MSFAFFERVMESERTGLAAEQKWQKGVPCIGAVEDIGILKAIPSGLRQEHPVNLEAIGRTSFVQSCPSLGYRFLWVHVENRRYRHDYRLHLKRTYGDALPPIPSDLHVDHLFSRGRARAMGMVYLRTALLPAAVNVSHGGGWEKFRTSDFGGGKRIRSIDTTVLMKLFGFQAPPTDGRVTPEIARFAAEVGPRIGADPADLATEIANLMNVARRSRDMR